MDVPAAKKPAPAGPAPSTSPATSQAALQAAAAQARLDAAHSASGSVPGDSAAPTTNDASVNADVPALPTVDRSVFGAMLKRRRFNRPALAVAVAPPPLTPNPELLSQLSNAPEVPAPVPPPPPPPPPPHPRPLHRERCDRDGHTEDNCAAYPEGPLTHPDAQLGAAAPPLLERLEVRCQGPLVVINGVAYQRGVASGAGCNCLIDTLRQHLQVIANVPAIRRALQKLYRVEPTIVTAENFLEFRAHALEIVNLLARAAALDGDPIDTAVFRIICVDLDHLDHGDFVGNGDVTLYIARENGNHFIPLHEL